MTAEPIVSETYFGSAISQYLLFFTIVDAGAILGSGAELQEPSVRGHTERQTAFDTHLFRRGGRSRRMDVTGIDHLVLYVEDIGETCEFYAETLGVATVETFAGDRVALSFGSSKINLHPAGDEYEPHAETPAPGSGDFCLIVDDPISAVVDRLEEADIPLVKGPVDQQGAHGPMRSVYVRDPDGNLVEFARYD